MPKERSANFQWISLVYLVLFAMAVFAPSLVHKDYFGIPEQHVEEFLIFLFGFAGITIFMLYERLMETKEKEEKQMRDAWENAKRELVSSYKYIGSLNRQMEMLKKLTNDTSVSIMEQDRLGKDLLQSLATAAAANVGGKTATLRFVHLEKLRTEREVHSTSGSNGNGNGNGNGQTATSILVANKDLKRAHEERKSYLHLNGEGQNLLVVPSDKRQGEVKAFLIVHAAPPENEEFDPSVLKVFANQAELVYGSLRKEDLSQRPPMDLVDAATKKPTGEIE